MAGQWTEAPWDDRDPRLDPMIGPTLGDRGLDELTLDESSIRVEMEPYPRIKPACNNNFVPLVKDGLADGVRKLTDSVITEQLNALTANLPFAIRRIELAPSGAYLVVAQDYNDAQHAAMKLAGLGLAADPGLFCRPELGDSDFAHLERAGIDFTVQKRGITR